MRYYTQVAGEERVFTFTRRDDGLVVARSDDGRESLIDCGERVDGLLSLIVDGRSHDVHVEPVPGGAFVQVRGERVRVRVEDERERAAKAVAAARPAGKQEIAAVMPGVVAEVRVEVGDAVEAGQTLLVLEAMKMQNPVVAEAEGVVAAVHVETGEAVRGGAKLIGIDPPESAARADDSRSGAAGGG